jgi:hypothetical protein
MCYMHTTNVFYTSIHRVCIDIYKALYGLQRIYNDVKKTIIRSIYTYIGLADGHTAYIYIYKCIHTYTYLHTYM